MVNVDSELKDFLSLEVHLCRGCLHDNQEDECPCHCCGQDTTEPSKFSQQFAGHFSQRIACKSQTVLYQIKNHIVICYMMYMFI